MNPNRAFLNSLSILSEASEAELIRISEFKSVAAGTQIVKRGKIPRKVYLLVSGIIRSYINTESGKEFNKNFYFPVSFVGSLTALIKRKPSLFGFETLTDCELYEIDYNALMALCKNNKSINRLFYRVLEKSYITYEKRYVELLSLDAKARYLELRKRIPQVDMLIPQYQIASYLGITPVQLSRIRKKLCGD